MKARCALRYFLNQAAASPILLSERWLVSLAHLGALRGRRLTCAWRITNSHMSKMTGVAYNLTRRIERRAFPLLPYYYSQRALFNVSGAFPESPAEVKKPS